MRNNVNRCNTISKNTIKSLGISFDNEREEELFHSFVNDELEERIGASISRLLSCEQLHEFDCINDTAEAQKWLEMNVPTYKWKVAREIEEIKLMLMRLVKDISTSESDHKEIRSLPLNCLDLSTRTYNSLVRYGITAIGELIDIAPEEFPRIRNLSVKCLNEIEAKLKEKFNYQIVL